MHKPVVLVGVGEMGGVFARGFLRSGYPLIPITRATDMHEVAKELAIPELVMVAVAEGDLHGILETLPQAWRTRVGLLQNELLPRDWQRHRLPDPTVISVWFEKKKGQDARVILPSPVYGPHAPLIHAALTSIDIPCRILASEDELLEELVIKNVYILTSNIAGLKVGGTVGELWQRHRALAEQLAHEVIDIQEWLNARSLPRAHLIAGMVAAFDGDPEHRCMGRSAPARLQRALKLADEAGLEVPGMRAIASTQAPAGV